MNYIPANYLPTNYLSTNYLPTNYLSTNYNPSNENSKSIPLNLNIKLGIMILFTYIVINGMSEDIKNSIKKEFTKHAITRDKLFSLLYKKLLVVPFIVSFYWAVFNIVLKVIYHLINQLLYKPNKCKNNNNTTDNNSNIGNNTKTNKKSFKNSISNMANRTKENFANKLQGQKGKLTGLANDARRRLLKGGVNEVNNNISKKEELTLNLSELLFQGIMNDILLLMYITVFNIILISIINVLMVLPAKDNEIDENGLDNIFLVYKISYILSFLLLYMQINLE